MEERFDFYKRGPYKESVPRPQTTLRFDVGDHHTTYAQMEKVVERIANAAPDRVRIYEIGTTNEHRMQYLIAISSPENIERIEEIRANVKRLADPRSTTAAEAGRIAENTPAIAWMAYTIHGNESASFEAMMQVVYQLAASDEPATLDILKNTVTLILPGENPDGHERFVTWYNSVATGDPNRSAIEHREPWSIFGRYNRYRFDLNRDPLAMTQKETRNMQAAYIEWNPQVLVDHHGQPSQYFFPPVASPINPNLPQPATNRWQERFGRANARAFDANKWDYYVRDVFDAFYPGYWDMYPSLNGAIAMTYETDGGGFKGLNWTRDDGTIVTLRSAIAKHFVASMTTLETLSANKTESLREFHAFRVKGMEDHARSAIKRIVITPEADRVKAAEMVEVLRRSNIEVNVTSSTFSSTTARTYMEKDAKPVTRTFPAGSYIIDLNQPQRLIKSILEPDTPQDKAFVDDNINVSTATRCVAAASQGGLRILRRNGLVHTTGIRPERLLDKRYRLNSRISCDRRLYRESKRGNVSGHAQIAYIIPYDTDSTGHLFAALKAGTSGQRSDAFSECCRKELARRYVRHPSF